DCVWTDWIDVSYPDSSDRNSGDYETFENIRKNDSSWVCVKAENISCRSVKFPDVPLTELGQKVECSVDKGLICNNWDQGPGDTMPMPVCHNYEISVCCIPDRPECRPSTGLTSTSGTTTVSTTTPPTSQTTFSTLPTPIIVTKTPTTPS
ncbi:MUC5A protein, partial [Ceuthmochares aereus]|nr:MUC5A protein [Ceuthmochares aereus]